MLTFLINDESLESNRKNCCIASFLCVSSWKARPITSLFGIILLSKMLLLRIPYSKLQGKRSFVKTDLFKKTCAFTRIANHTNENIITQSNKFLLESLSFSGNKLCILRTASNHKEKKEFFGKNPNDINRSAFLMLRTAKVNSLGTVFISKRYFSSATDSALAGNSDEGNNRAIGNSPSL